MVSISYPSRRRPGFNSRPRSWLLSLATGERVEADWLPLAEEMILHMRELLLDLFKAVAAHLQMRALLDFAQSRGSPVTGVPQRHHFSHTPRPCKAFF